MEANKKIVEVNGIKRIVEEYKIGDPVKVLVKEYGDTFTSYPGIIAGFDSFKERSTIIVVYVYNKYNTCEIKTAYITKDSKDIEICPMSDAERKIDREAATALLDRDISKKEAELQDLIAKKDYFVIHFNKYFSEL